MQQCPYAWHHDDALQSASCTTTHSPSRATQAPNCLHSIDARQPAAVTTQVLPTCSHCPWSSHISTSAQGFASAPYVYGPTGPASVAQPMSSTPSQCHRLRIARPPDLALLRAINAKQVNQRINSSNPRRRHVTTPARHSSACDAEALGNGAARLPVVVHRLPQRLAPGAFTHAAMVRQRGAGVNAFRRKG